MKDVGELRRRIAGWTITALMLVASAPDAVAGGLMDHMAGLWATATALSFALITAVGANQK